MKWQAKKDEAFKEMTLLISEFANSVVIMASENFDDFEALMKELDLLVSNFVDQLAFQMSWAVCPNKCIRFVVKELHMEDDGLSYLIRFGVPANSTCHMVNQVGRIYTDPPKWALIEAIEQDTVIEVKEARTNPLTEYMRGWAEIHGIESLAVVPIGLQTKFPFLVVIDVVEPSRDFTAGQIDFLKKGSIMASAAIKDASATIERLTKLQIERICYQNTKVLSSMEDKLRNRLMELGGFARILVNAAEARNFQKIEECGKVVKASVTRLEAFASLLGVFANKKNERTPEKRTLSAYLSEVFRRDDLGNRFQFQMDSTVEEIETELPVEMTVFLLNMIRDYMLQNDESGEFTVTVRFNKKKGTLEIDFPCKGFQSFKLEGNKDLELLFILDSAKQLGGQARIDRSREGLCQLSIPRYVN
jgi:hypothetical protein